MTPQRIPRTPFQSSRSLCNLSGMETSTAEIARAPSNSDAEAVGQDLRVVFEKLEPWPKGFRLHDMYRSKVPGGWLVLTGPARVGMAFVPDPNHSWLAPVGVPLKVPRPPAATTYESST